MAEQKRYAIPEKFLLDCVLAFYDLRDKSTDNDIAENILKKMSIYSVQLLAADMGFPLSDVLKKRIEEIKKELDEKGDIISYAEL